MHSIMSPRHTTTAAIGGDAVVVQLRIVFTSGVSTAPAQSLIRHCDPCLCPYHISTLYWLLIMPSVSAQAEAGNTKWASFAVSVMKMSITTR